MSYKKTLILLLLMFIMPFPILAYSDYIIVGGDNIGIELNSKNIMVVGLYEVNGKNSANEAGIKVGDLITSVDDKEVVTIDDMVDAISQNKSGEISLKVLRNDKSYNIKLPVYKDENNIYKTGLYVKDSITGIGTLSFIDPNTKLFGALGHEIIEKSTGKILEIKDGKIYDSTVTNINRSDAGVPGEKNADIDTNDVDGKIKKNTVKGIFGTYTKEIKNNNLYKVALPSEVKTGKAKILTVLSGKEVKEYEINITKVKNNNNEIKNIIFEITDEELLSVAGGIVQGMSGSPIIQDKNVIGAVTHVVVDNPVKGYGIFITKMLEEAES